jgi:hypothetical protein
MKFSAVLKAIAEVNYYKSSTIQGLYIKPYDMHLGLYNTGSQVVSQSSSEVSDNMNLSQHPQYSSISSTHNKFTSKA